MPMRVVVLICLLLAPSAALAADGQGATPRQSGAQAPVANTPGSRQPSPAGATQQAAARPQAGTSQEPAKESNDDDHHDVTGSFIETGDFPNSIKIPGTTFSLKFGGYGKVDFIQDFDSIGNQDEFQTKTIPIEGTRESMLGGANNIHAKESRFYFDVRSPTPIGNFRGYIEIDFYGSGGSSAPHLRHAYGVIGHLLGGQTWTTFMDISARPKTVDFEGADSSIFIRQAMLRWEQPFGNGFRWAVAVEDASPEITIPDGFDGEVRASMPDIVGRIRYDWGGSHTQFAAMARQLRYASSTGDSTGAGWGFNWTGSWKVGSAQRDSFNWQVSYGEGIGRYVRSFTGTDSDAVIGPDGELQILPVQSYVFGYRHFWTPNLRSGVIFAIARLTNQSAQPADAIHQTRSPRVNLLWSPWHLVDIGGEYMWGERQNADGSKGDASRLHFAIKFRFPG